MLRHFPGELNLNGDGTIVLDGTPTLRARRDAIGAEVNRGNVVATAMVGVTQHRRKATTSEARGSPRPVQRAQKRVRVGCVFGTTNPTRQVRERRRSIFRERQTDFDRSLGRDAIPAPPPTTRDRASRRKRQKKIFMQPDAASSLGVRAATSPSRLGVDEQRSAQHGHGLRGRPMLRPLVPAPVSCGAWARNITPSRALRIRLCERLETRDGGGGRTRTFEAMRRLIYSQLPLPLGTLPRSTAAQSRRTLPADRKRPWRREDRDSPGWFGGATGRVYERSGGAKSTEAIS